MVLSRVLRSKVAPQLTVVTTTSARSGVAVLVQDVHAASVVPNAAAAHATTTVRASSSTERCSPAAMAGVVFWAWDKLACGGQKF